MDNLFVQRYYSPMVSERSQRQIERLLDEAEQTVKSGQWDVVRARAQTVSARDPKNADALTFSAAAERSPGNPGAKPVAPSAAAQTATRLPTVPEALLISLANGRAACP